MPKLQANEVDSGPRHRRGRRISSSLAEINVVPLVDVMLVMLIIFMVTAPMMQRGVDVSLPVSRRASAITDERIFVTVPFSYLTDRRVMIGDESVGLDVLAERIRQELLTRTEKDVFIRTEGSLQVQDLFDVLDELQDGGVQSLGVLTDPPTER